MTAADWQEVIQAYKEIVKNRLERIFPRIQKEQLFLSVNAVFDSWNNQRAIVYRRLQKNSGASWYSSKYSEHGLWKYGK
ncbi:hypothetical protein GCM10020331_013000 [Ectobacillus funiculus]